MSGASAAAIAAYRNNKKQNESIQPEANVTEMQTINVPESETKLEKASGFLDWIDWAFIILSVSDFFYHQQIDAFHNNWFLRALANFPINGAPLYLLSFAITVAAIVVAVKFNKIRKLRGLTEGRIRRNWRWVTWAIWIPIDLLFLILSVA